MNSSSPRLFEILTDENQIFKKVTKLQLIHLISACNVYALREPGQDFSVHVSVGDITQVPAIAKDFSFAPATPGKEQLGVLTLKSLATGNPNLVSEYIVRLPHPEATPASTKPPAKVSLPRTVYRELEKRAPLLLDLIRESIMKRREKLTNSPFKKASDTTESSISSFSVSSNQVIVFGLHWLQTGGAEHWAFETIKITKEKGFLPLVVTDQPSVHPQAENSLFDGCVLLMLNFESPDKIQNLRFNEALINNFKLNALIIHHSYWLYQSLPWFKKHSPETPTFDSLHIIEYLEGGYPGLSATFDDFIDSHHVISPQLVDWLTNIQKVNSNKITLAPLNHLSTDSIAKFKKYDQQKPFTISFVGRLSRQKRPDVFLMLARALKNQDLNVRIIMHGDGEMNGVVHEMVDRFKLTNSIERRDETHSVKDTLLESDLLVISSINEGITLTTFEANSLGVPVISTDVGSQGSIITSPALLPRAARPFIKQSLSIIKRLILDETLREEIWQAQSDNISKLDEFESASDFFERLLVKWKK